MNKILETLEAEREELADWRHDFHMHPELGLEETRTAGIVAQKLRSWGIELTEDGLGLKGGIENAKATKIQVAANTGGTNAYEGSYILKRGKYYYLFCSTGTCCDGANSTYQTVVCRSTELFGPYLNKSGDNMNDNKHEVLIHRNDAFLGTGHNAEIVQDDEGKDWIIYHAYRTADPSLGRVVLLDRVYWDDDDWPYLVGDGPVVKAEAPTFKKSK